MQARKCVLPKFVDDYLVGALMVESEFGGKLLPGEKKNLDSV